MNHSNASRSSELNASTQTSASRSLWIINPSCDLTLILLTPLIVMAICSAAHHFSLLYAFTTFGLILSVGHYLPGMLRAYGDRALFRRYPLRFTLVPAGLLAVCLFFSWYSLDAVVFCMMIWGFWHWTMQAYGFARIYDAKVRSHDTLTAWLDYAICITWFVYILMIWNGNASDILRNFYTMGGPILSSSVFETFDTVWTGVTMFVTALFFLNAFKNWKEGHPPSPLKILLLMTTISFYGFTTSYASGSALVGYVLFESCHDIQYLAIAWLFNRNRSKNDPNAGPLIHLLFRKRTILILAYVALCLAFGSSRYAIQAFAFNTRIAMSVISALALYHYYLDGFIWKLRDPATRNSLGVSDTREPGPTSIVQIDHRPWLRHALLWLLFVVPVGALGYLQRYGSTIDSIAVEKGVALAFPHDQGARLNVCGMLSSSGRIAEAKSWCDEAVELNPDSMLVTERTARILINAGRFEDSLVYVKRLLRQFPEDFTGHFCQAVIYQQRGQLKDAVVHYKRAIRAQPGDASVHNRLGITLFQLGRLDESRRELEIAIFIEPKVAEYHDNLAKVQRQQRAQRSGSVGSE